MRKCKERRAEEQYSLDPKIGRKRLRAFRKPKSNHSISALLLNLNGLHALKEPWQQDLPMAKPKFLHQFPGSFYRKHLIVIYQRWFTFRSNTMRENAHGETDPR